MARRPLNVFNLSFLDCMSCGFGAVILFYMIINTGSVRGPKSPAEAALYGEVSRLEQIAEEGRAHLVVLKTDLEKVDAEGVAAESELERELAALSGKRAALRALEAETLARKQSLAQKMADLRSAEEANARLEGGSLGKQQDGEDLRTIAGDGRRQYLTGIAVGGQRIMILVDTSASMLDEEISRVLVRRNQSKAERIASPKWQRVLDAVDWMSAQIPADSKFQIYGFAEKAEPVLPGTAGKWVDASAPGQLDDAIARLRSTAPTGGTSLFHAMRALGQMSPKPDNVFLIVDGLPTQGEKAPWRSTVNERTRLSHLARAIGQMPSGVPLNILLFPMEGDPSAATAYWQLARRSGGAFLAPSKDWP